MAGEQLDLVAEPAAPALEWEQRSKYHQQTKCERYSVCCMYVLGVPIYIAWYGGQELASMRAASADRAHRLNAAEVMRRVCMAHAARSGGENAELRHDAEQQAVAGGDGSETGVLPGGAAADHSAAG